MPVGLYIHFPFCASKCPYCDFYSARADAVSMDIYTQAVINAVRVWQNKGVHFDTVYFGGGTPSLLGDRLCRIADALKGEPIREFTVECNPSQIADGLFEKLLQSGVNRISMGLQSAVDAERRALGRTASVQTVDKRIREAYAAGFRNISLDLMLGIPGQTEQSLEDSLNFCGRPEVTHVSAYLLKIEEGTHFYTVRDTLALPDEDETCALYLQAADGLAKRGLRQYEISNFSRAGFESRHNLKYWNDEAYIGIGPAAHSFMHGKRFYYERDTEAFLRGAQPVPDGEGGSFEEYAMLRLRLSEGLSDQGTAERFGHPIPQTVRDRARTLPKHLCIADADGIRFTKEGFLLSNSLISTLLS